MPGPGEPPRSAPGPAARTAPARRGRCCNSPAAAETAAPDRRGEICQQFATTLVITFLESAAIDVKIRELPRLSPRSDLFAATYSSS